MKVIQMSMNVLKILIIIVLTMLVTNYSMANLKENDNGHLSIKASETRRDSDSVINIPDYLKRFVKEGSVPVEVEGQDLNGDRIEDYLIITVTDDGSAPELHIVLGQKNGNYKEVATNKNLLECAACTGMAGGWDVKAFYKGFKISNDSGSASGHSVFDCKFKYINKSSTWMLVEVIGRGSYREDDYQVHADSSGYVTKTETSHPNIEFSAVTDMCGGGGI